MHRSAPPAAGEPQRAAMTQLPLPIARAHEQRFDNFVAGANAGAVAALQAAAAGAAGQASSPLYLWGAAGAGKTHLLRAAAAAATVPHRAFGAAVAAPWTLGDADRLLLLDDCDHLDTAQQHAAFGLFVEAAASGATVIAAGRVPPVDLPVREDLRTRLGWGPVFQLLPLDDALAAEALRRDARERVIPIGADVIDYLLTHFARDLGSQVALLDALDQHAIGLKRPVTVPLVKQLLAARPDLAGTVGPAPERQP